MRERKKAETRRRITEAAHRLFGERGFQAVTVVEVARAAEVAEATLFNYFPGKVDAVLGPVPEPPAQALEVFRANGPHGDLVEDLGELFDVDLDDSDVETVGGLLAQRLGRVPLPGAEAEIAGLKLRAEGGKDHRGRIRINALLVRPVNADHAPLRGADQEGSNTRG